MLNGTDLVYWPRIPPQPEVVPYLHAIVRVECTTLCVTTVLDSYAKWNLLSGAIDCKRFQAVVTLGDLTKEKF